MSFEKRAMSNPPFQLADETETVDDWLGSFPTTPASVIPLLQQIQARYGYISESNLVRVAKYTHTPLSRVYGVTTFYSQFRLYPRGRHLIRICQGTACHVLGANDILEHIKERLRIEEGQTTSEGLFTLESVRCLGCCSLAPVMMIDDTTYGRLTRKTVDEIIASYPHKEEE